MAGREKRPSPRRWILLGTIVLLGLAAILPPLVSVGRYRRRIAAGISRSIGQPVHMSSVKLRLLPRPGFELTDFVVEEKPGFGAEPILRCPSVVASLRLWSLWRGDLEIARIDFDEASLNLVRAPDGAWNFASILIQAARVQAARTPSAGSAGASVDRHSEGGAARFPYIEATDSRINFKQGDEKKPLSFFNSDLSVWLENANEWGLHFRAQPVRTDLDLDLADTGILRIDGTLRRAEALGEMPVHLKAEWSNVPLGQLSRLTIGRDIGWRGDLDLQAEVSGSADLTRIRTQFKVDGLHRWEFNPAHTLDIATSCEASYSKPSASFEDIACASPVGDGMLRLTGHLRNTQSAPQGRLDLDIRRVPASAVLAALEEVRDGLGGFKVAGVVNGHFEYLSPGAADAPSKAPPPRNPRSRKDSRTPPAPSSGAEHSFSGEMGASSLTLLPDGAERPFLLSGVRLVTENQNTAASTAPQPTGAAPPSVQPALLLEPVRLGLGAPVPLTVDGRFTPAGFDFHLRGPGTLARLRLLNHALGLLSASTGGLSPATGVLPEASAGDLTLDVSIRGPWLLPIPDAEHPFASSTTLGSITVKDAEVSAPYLSRPLLIASAQAVLGPNEVSWTNASISYGTLKAQGALEYPTVCTSTPPCAAQFQLTAAALDLAELQSVVFGTGQSSSGELLREILGRIERHSAPWPPLSGTIEVGALSSGKLVLNDATGALDIAGHAIAIRSLSGRLLNGAMHLAGTLDAAGDQPKYNLDVQVANASPSTFATLFGEEWGGGVLNLSAQWKMEGFRASELAQSAQGVLHWNWTRGSLITENPLPATAQPLLHFDDWSGDAAIEDSAVKIRRSLLARGRQVIPISGTISFDRQLALVSEPVSTGFSITGTLEHAAVKMPTAEAEAHPAPLHAGR